MRCVLGRLAERLRTKPAVVPVGRVSRCSRPKARDFRAAWQPTLSSCYLSRARHMRYVPGHSPRRVTACVHLQPTNRCPMFVSLQLGTGTPAPIATIIGGDVAVVFSAATCSFFDDSMLAGALQSLPRVAERRHGAVRRRSRLL